MNELDLNCDAVQEGLSLLRTGGAGLTDWALLERHARQCESCRTRERLEATAIAAPRAATVHQPRYWLEKVQSESRLRMTSFVAWVGPRLEIAWARAGQAAASVSRLLASLMQVGVLAAAGVADIVGRVGRRSRKAYQQAAPSVMTGAAAAGGLVAQGLDRLTRMAPMAPGGLDRVTRGVGSGLFVLSTAGRRAGRAMTEAGASMVPHAQALGSQLRRAAVKVSGVRQATGQQARALVASLRSVVVYAARPPLLTAGTAMVGLVILIAATPLWWPRAWHVERVARLAAPDNPAMTPAAGVQVVQPPLDRKSAEPPVAARLIRTARPIPSSLGLADGVARSERNADRSDSLAHPTGSTATSGAGASREPGRRQEPARTPRVTADAPDDASAAVDWLLDNTRARR